LREAPGAAMFRSAMPTLLKFLGTILLIAALLGGGMLALVLFVEPRPREITVPVPAERLNRDQGNR
jgi:hypothetical protein